MFFIGIDLGGTKVSGIIINEKKKVLGRAYHILEQKNHEYVTDKIFSVIDELAKGRKIKAIGIGIPGSFDGRKIIELPNLPSMNGIELKKIIGKKYKAKVIIENDARCFAYGESVLRKKENIVGITIGTGLGGGVIINGRIYHGMGFAGEFGHMTVEPNGRQCSCGNRGCLEEYSSGKALEKEADKIYGERIKADNLANLARRSDAKAQQIFENFGKYLGIGLSDINCAFNPEIIVIGGGVSKSSDMFLHHAINEMKKRCFIPIPKIEISQSDGSLGAALLASGKK